ncbi:MAG: hypothetical protein ABIH34_06465 [Nanoarchaeota archaeon]
MPALEDLPVYMKRELITYISKELEHGSQLQDIERILKNRGHQMDLIQEAIGALKRNEFDVDKAHTDPMDNVMQRRLSKRILKSLIKYITHYRKKGFSLDTIKEALLNYGHTDETIQSALDELQNKTLKKEEKFRMVVVSISLVTVVLFMIIITLLTDSPTPRILAGFLPLLASLLITVTFIKNKSRNFLWGVPIVFCIAFYFIGLTGQIQALELMDIEVLTLLNFVVSYVYLLLLLQPIPIEWISKS